QVASALRAALVGEPASTFDVGDMRGEVVLGIEEGGTHWAQLPIDQDNGTRRTITLADVVRVTKADAPRDLLHIDRRRAVAVYVRGNAKTSAGALTTAVKTVLSGARVRTVPASDVDRASW